MHFEEGMTVTCHHPNWFSMFGQSIELPMGTKLTVSRSWNFNGLKLLDFKEYPDNSFIAYGFKPYLN